MSAPQITLYSNKASPYGHCVEIALREAKAEYSLYDVNLMKKPAWFVEKVNSAGKAPAITYGGPLVRPDEPSPASFKLTESLVILEFITEIFPESNLLPRDPVDRASARFLVNLFAEKLRTVQSDVLFKRGSPQEVIATIDELQKYMPAPGDNKGPYVNGNTFTSIDAIAAAFLIRMDGCLKRDVGSFREGKGIKAYRVLRTSERYERYRAYLSALLQRESVLGTFPEEQIFVALRNIYLPLRVPV